MNIGVTLKNFPIKPQGYEFKAAKPVIREGKEFILITFEKEYSKRYRIAMGIKAMVLTIFTLFVGLCFKEVQKLLKKSLFGVKKINFEFSKQVFNDLIDADKSVYVPASVPANSMDVPAPVVLTHSVGKGTSIGQSLPVKKFELSDSQVQVILNKAEVRDSSFKFGAQRCTDSDYRDLKIFFNKFGQILTEIIHNPSILDDLEQNLDKIIEREYFKLWYSTRDKIHCIAFKNYMSTINGMGCAIGDNHFDFPFRPIDLTLCLRIIIEDQFSNEFNIKGNVRGEGGVQFFKI